MRVDAGVIKRLNEYPFLVVTWVDDAGYPISEATTFQTDGDGVALRLTAPGLAIPTDREVSVTGSHIRPQPGVGYDEPPTVHCPNCGGSLVRRAGVTPFEDITRAIHAGRYDGEGGVALFRCDVLARFGGGHADLHAAYLKYGESRAPQRERVEAYISVSSSLARVMPT